jgi:hypothetical protein
MGKLVPASKPVPTADDARVEIEGRLEKWRCELVAFDRGASNQTLTRTEIWDRIDMWLDRLLELRGH